MITVFLMIMNKIFKDFHTPKSTDKHHFQFNKMNSSRVRKFPKCESNELQEFYPAKCFPNVWPFYANVMDS